MSMREKIYEVLGKQQFATWYNDGGSYGDHLCGMDNCKTKEQIFDDIDKLFGLKTEFVLGKEKELCENTAIMCYHTSKDGLQEVYKVLQKSGLPVRCYTTKGSEKTQEVVHFVYADRDIKFCDGNTTHELERIIQSLIRLYK